MLVALRQWGGAHCLGAGTSDTILVERTTGLPIRKLAPQAADDRPLAREEIMLVKRTGASRRLEIS